VNMCRLIDTEKARFPAPFLCQYFGRAPKTSRFRSTSALVEHMPTSCPRDATNYESEGQPDKREAQERMSRCFR
jgi:hypothetical protein